MSHPIQTFLSAVGDDRSLQEEVKLLLAGTTPQNLQDVARRLSELAEGMNLTITAKEIASRITFADSDSAPELSEAELAAVAGGLTADQKYASVAPRAGTRVQVGNVLVNTGPTLPTVGP